MQCDLLVIGAGPAGLAAALSAYENGVHDIIIVERDNLSGGILNQCIHNGFGLHYFKEELTGPEYAERFENKLKDTSVVIKKNTMVTMITPDKEVHMVSSSEGYQVFKPKAIVLAMGCRERTRGAVQISGDRGSGVFTAGTAQRYMNIEGYMVGKKVVILGSGDIGLIMARRMKLEGAEVLAVLELMPYSNGLNRNIVQCLHDYDIPLYLSHTVTEIRGKKRVEQIVASKVDENRNPISGSEIVFNCDTLLLSVGLLPENELTKNAEIDIDKRSKGAVVFDDMQTLSEGVFACGNVLHVHDLVDFVTLESMKAGRFAAEYIKNPYKHSEEILEVENGVSIIYTIPQKIDFKCGDEKFDIYFRVNRVIEKGIVTLTAEDGTVIYTKKKDYLLPAEMEKISLDKIDLKKYKKVTLSIS